MLKPERSLQSPLSLNEFMSLEANDFKTNLNDLCDYGEAGPPETFSKALIFYMKKKKITVEELSDAAGLSSRAVQNMRKDEDMIPKLDSVVKICIALCLRPSESYRLIELAGYKLNESRTHKLYKYILDICYMERVEECIAFIDRAKAC